MTTQTLDCQQLVELVSGYLDGALRPIDRDRVEAHLTQCDGCGDYVQQVRRMLELTRGMPQPELPAQRTETLLQAFRAATDPDHPTSP